MLSVILTLKLRSIESVAPVVGSRATITIIVEILGHYIPVRTEDEVATIMVHGRERAATTSPGVRQWHANYYGMTDIVMNQRSDSGRDSRTGDTAIVCGIVTELCCIYQCLFKNGLSRKFKKYLFSKESISILVLLLSV